MTSTGHGEVSAQVLVEGDQGGAVVGFPAPDLGGGRGGGGEEAAEGAFVVGGGFGLLHAGEVHLWCGGRERWESGRVWCDEKRKEMMTLRLVQSNREAIQQMTRSRHLWR